MRLANHLMFVLLFQAKAEWTIFNVLAKSTAEARSMAKAMANEEAFTSGALSDFLDSLQVPLHAYPLKTLLKFKTTTIVRLRKAVLANNREAGGPLARGGGAIRKDSTPRGVFHPKSFCSSP